MNDIVQNLGHALRDKHILLLGAGGAAQGVLQPLVEAMPRDITVANRNVDKAHLMVKRLSIEQEICNISALSFDALTQHYDVIINATSTGLTDTALPISNTIFAKIALLTT